MVSSDGSLRQGFGILRSEARDGLVGLNRDGIAYFRFLLMAGMQLRNIADRRTQLIPAHYKYTP